MFQSPSELLYLASQAADFDVAFTFVLCNIKQCVRVFLLIGIWEMLFEHF